MKFAAFGRTHWLYESVRAAVARGHEAVLIGTCQAAPEYRVSESDFQRLAEELGCDFFCDAAINLPKYVELAANCCAEVAISVNWLTIIREEMLSRFRHGVINAHMGDLPRYRGNACPNWAILENEERVVLTLHQMEVELDAGPVLLQRSCKLTPDTYIADLYRFADENIPSMFVEALDGLEAGTLVPEAQPTDPSLSLRCFPRMPEDGRIDWRQPAEQLARLVRASAEPFAGAYSFINGEPIIIWRAHSSRLSYPYLGVPGQVAERNAATGEVSVLTGDGVLVLEEVESEAEGRTRASSIIKSTRLRLGLDLEAELMRLRSEIEDLKKRLSQTDKG